MAAAAAGNGGGGGGDGDWGRPLPGYWQNLYHASDAFGAPMRPAFAAWADEAAMVEDVAVGLGGATVASAGAHGLHAEYFAKRASADVAAPIAEHLARLWLAANQPLAAGAPPPRGHRLGDSLRSPRRAQRRSSGTES